MLDLRDHQAPWHIPPRTGLPPSNSVFPPTSHSSERMKKAQNVMPISATISARSASTAPDHQQEPAQRPTRQRLGVRCARAPLSSGLYHPNPFPIFPASHLPYPLSSLPLHSPAPQQLLQKAQNVMIITATFSAHLALLTSARRLLQGPWLEIQFCPKQTLSKIPKMSCPYPRQSPRPHPRVTSPLQFRRHAQVCA